MRAKSSDPRAQKRCALLTKRFSEKTVSRASGDERGSQSFPKTCEPRGEMSRRASKRNSKGRLPSRSEGWRSPVPGAWTSAWSSVLTRDWLGLAAGRQHPPFDCEEKAPPHEVGVQGNPQLPEGSFLFRLAPRAEYRLARGERRRPGGPEKFPKCCSAPNSRETGAPRAKSGTGS